MKLSPAQTTALENVAQGRDIGCHLAGRSQHGGFGQTIRSLRDRGLIEMGTDEGDGWKITIAGRNALAHVSPSRIF